jgi:nitronate monooxygenase
MAGSYPKIETALTRLLNIEYPIIMAPMFLVTNDKMMIEALNSGIAGAIPALNYRTIPELKNAINNIRKYARGPIGINLIVNQSNIKYPEQLDCCVEMKVDFIITSLGSPEEVIKKCKPHGIKVICDVVDELYAKKVEDLGADAVIAVNNEAGGHCGTLDGHTLINKIKAVCKLPVISAGGVGNGAQMFQKIEFDGACGVSVGSPFIATPESPVSEDYKNACVIYGAKDIVLTTKISGTPCTVINTPYVQKIGTQQNWLEKLLSKNKTLKKYIKMFTFLKGMKAVEKAAMSATYKTVWVAGKTIEYVDAIRPTKEIVERFISEYYEELGRSFNTKRS